MNQQNTLIIALATLTLLLGVGSLYLFAFLPNTNPDKNTTGTTLAVSQAGGNLPASNAGHTQYASDQPSEHAFTFGADVATSTWNSDDFYIVYPPDSISSSTPEYEIHYFPSESSFLMGIFEEPIGEIRRKATADLANRLGISGTDVCALSVRVAVPEWVNDYYASRNLGFPGCPGAVKFQGD